MKWVPKTSTNPKQSCNVGCIELRCNYSPQQQTSSVCQGTLSLPNWGKLAINWKRSTLFVWCPWVFQRALICHHLKVSWVEWRCFYSWIKKFSKSSTASETSSWQGLDRCHSCALRLENNSVRCNKDGLYFFYAQVEFSNNREKKNQTKSVTFKRDASHGISMRILVDASFPNTTVGSVWVAKVVSFRDGDSFRIQIEGDFQIEGTFWGLYELH